MSNKIVPGIYRAVIDEVIANIKPEFEEYGVNEDVLAELHAKWQAKVIASHVAEFDTPPAQQQPQQLPYGGHPIHIMQTHPYPATHHPYAPPPPPGQPNVKMEPVDNRYMLQSGYQLSSLPGPPPMTAQPTTHLAPQTSVLSFPTGPGIRPPSMQNGSVAGTPLGRPYVPPAQTATASSSMTARIPQVDGPADSDDDDDSPSPPAFAPRSAHPSLPKPQGAQSPSAQEEEAINSDLDDSDSENEEEADEGGIGETDIVFCTYDKVARVKNKWKCILKDGMIHVNGRDYLFQKCTGEFEW